MNEMASTEGAIVFITFVEVDGWNVSEATHSE